MASVFNEKNVFEKEPSILHGLCDEDLKYVDNVEPRFYIREDVEENDKYKWYEVIDGETVKRNNIDPDLTPDGLPTTELQLKKIEEAENKQELTEDEKLKKHRREMLQRIRCIALNAMGKDILFDPRRLQPKDRRDYVKRIEELYILSEEEIIIMFNRLCHDTVFINGADYSNYPVYDV